MVESVTPYTPEGKAAKPGSLPFFFSLTFVVTWATWLAAWALSRGGTSGYPPAGVGMVLFYLGVFTPGIASNIGWITAGLLWICAGYFLVQMRRRAI